MDVLTIRGLSKRFGDKQVLDGLDLTVPEHSIFGFVGQNGAGKTTTMKSVLGLLRPDGGRIEVAGQAVTYGETPTNRCVGYLPDVPAFYPFLTAREYLRLCGESLGMQSGEIRERSDRLLSLVGLADETHRIKGYSRGMKQRLGIAQALLGRPKLLLCDEPTSALDPIGRKEILDILLSVRDETTVVFSTHILTDVERICTEVAFLHGGRIALQGAVETLMQREGVERFTVQTADGGGARQLQQAFADARLVGQDTVSLAGDEDRMLAVLTYMRQHGLPIRRAERSQASLEALFMEVVKE
ncbi:MAG: ABC transporter ATP-binding protein [Ruminococcaceae bacterium]|nr:ABC transporter ATP-binding protein [Oscillospiraceae bacterium]